MYLRVSPYFLLLLLVYSGAISAQDTLTVEKCREMALTTNPLSIQKANAGTIAAFQTENVKGAGLPRISVGGQATFQSAVFGLPISSPLFEIPAVPKDQYKLSVDVAQRIWDGNTDKIRKQQYAAEAAAAVAQTEVDVYAIRDVVTDLFYRALLLQESAKILAFSKEDLNNRLKQAEGAVAAGVMLRTTADQIRIQILKTEQQLAGTEADRRTVMDLLALWIGRADSNFLLKLSPGITPTPIADRPEWRLFDTKENQLNIAQQSISLRKQPRIEAFAQGGWGNPNPLNFFDQGVFGLVGLRAQWTPFDWGMNRRDGQVLEIQKRNIAAQRSAFDLRMLATTTKDARDAAKYREQIKQDDAIIALQESILERADAQVQNGVISMTDYLTQVNLLTQAKLQRKTHEIMALSYIK